MIARSLLFALLLPGLAHAVICKSVDEDGVVSYTDVPAGECQQPIKLPDYSRYAPRPIQTPANQASPASGSVVPFDGYSDFSIVQPSANGTVRSNEGKVAVAMSLQPALQPGHSVSLTLDGRSVAGSFDGLTIELSGVNRGTHTLSAAVADASGRTLIESGPVRFTLRQVGLKQTAGEPPTPELPTEPGYRPPENGPDYTPPATPGYAPPQPPNYNPGSPPPAATPGRTNPAFAPKFTP